MTTVILLDINNAHQGLARFKTYTDNGNDNINNSHGTNSDNDSDNDYNNNNQSTNSDNDNNNDYNYNDGAKLLKTHR